MAFWPQHKHFLPQISLNLIAYKTENSGKTKTQLTDSDTVLSPGHSVKNQLKVVLYLCKMISSGETLDMGTNQRGKEKLRMNMTWELACASNGASIDDDWQKQTYGSHVVPY
jgi:hypothetical protein